MPVSASSRINRTADFASDGLLREFASDVRAGLSKPQKELHSKYLYDELGSALFEAITHLPEYGLTRADERLLEAHAGEIARSIPRPASVIELGSGTGQKTRHILSEMSGAALLPHRCFSRRSCALRTRVGRRGRSICAAAAYLDGMASAVAHRRSHETLLVLFLGSTIGNFERPCAIEFLRDLRRCLEPGDALLVGADLVKAPEPHATGI